MSKQNFIESNNSIFIVKSDIVENTRILIPDFKKEDKEVRRKEKQE